MKSMFAQTVSLQLRLFVAVLLSVILIIGDKYTEGGTNVRTSLNTLVSPLIYVANLPYEVFSFGAKSLHTRDQLLTENEALKKKQMLQSEQLQQYQFLSRENQKLRALLGSSAKPSNRKIIAQVLSVHSNPYSNQVVIPRGNTNGLLQSQTVMTDMAAVGQLTTVL